MSFTITVPRCETFEEFENAVYGSEAIPKIDARTKVGKKQRVLEREAADRLMDLGAYAEHDGQLSGKITGHVNEDLTGFVSVTLDLLGEAHP